MFDAIALHCFGVPHGGKCAEGSRVGRIKRVLLEHYPDLLDEQFDAAASAYKIDPDNDGMNFPRDPEKVAQEVINYMEGYKDEPGTERELRILAMERDGWLVDHETLEIIGHKTHGQIRE
jgi:hypothetical protein